MDAKQITETMSRLRVRVLRAADRQAADETRVAATTTSTGASSATSTPGPWRAGETWSPRARHL
ncbi:hypothetical protein QJS66_23725 (plasmid) [Kocuria rhizophila]|nr:hypothetical protein QJS66_23725 [Kocuria rhizophila]